MLDIRATRDKRNDQRLQSIRVPYSPPVLNAQGKVYRTRTDLVMVADRALPRSVKLSRRLAKEL